MTQNGGGVFGVLLLIAYVVNALKLFHADSTVSAVIHGFGLLGPACIITVWFQ